LRNVSLRLTVDFTTCCDRSRFHFSTAQVVMSDRYRPLKYLLNPSSAHFSR
jgi:hypothetical protein